MTSVDADLRSGYQFESGHWSESIIYISIIMAAYYIYMLRILNLVWNHFYSWGTNFRAFCGSTDPWIKDSHTIQNPQILEPTNVSFVSNPQLIWIPKLNMETDALLTEKPFTQFTSKSSWSVICCYKQHIHISNQLVEASNVMARNFAWTDVRRVPKFVRKR